MLGEFLRFLVISHCKPLRKLILGQTTADDYTETNVTMWLINCMLLCLPCEGLLTTFNLSSQAVCHLYRQQTFGGRFGVGSSARFDAVFFALIWKVTMLDKKVFWLFCFIILQLTRATEMLFSQSLHNSLKLCVKGLNYSEIVDIL